MRKVPVIIDLFATWCGPCLLLAEELEKVAKELGPEGVRIFKVDVDAEQELASQLQVRVSLSLSVCVCDCWRLYCGAIGALLGGARGGPESSGGFFFLRRRQGGADAG